MWYLESITPPQKCSFPPLLCRLTMKGYLYAGTVNPSVNHMRFGRIKFRTFTFLTLSCSQQNQTGDRHGFENQIIDSSKALRSLTDHSTQRALGPIRGESGVVQNKGTNYATRCNSQVVGFDFLSATGNAMPKNFWRTDQRTFKLKNNSMTLVLCTRGK